MLLPLLKLFTVNLTYFAPYHHFISLLKNTYITLNFSNFAEVYGVKQKGGVLGNNFWCHLNF